jgi:uncharacterized protein YjbI with pentapeptide repeats
MANEEHLRILRSGVEAWNEWRRANYKVQMDAEAAEAIQRSPAAPVVNRAIPSPPRLSGADLRGAKLIRIDLKGADLTNANLTATDLTSADLSNADLRYALLREAFLNSANLSDADLMGADLTNAKLYSTVARHCRLRDTNFDNATVGFADFVGVSLARVQNLSAIQHRGPTDIGISTLQITVADLADDGFQEHEIEIFLEGAGVPKDYIDFFRSRVGKPIQFYSCFISYSTKDQEFADRLHADLRSRNVRCWFAPHDLKPGRKIHEEIDAAIRLYDKLVLILSPDSIESKWVKVEIGKARRREIKEKRRMLFPVSLVDHKTVEGWECFDADLAEDSAREIREYLIPNFASWKTDHDAYKREFEKVVAALEATDRPTGYAASQ